MNKTTKNIILVVLLFVLIVSSYFTCEFIKRSNVPRFEYNYYSVEEKARPTIKNKKSRVDSNETIDNNETVESNETRKYKNPKEGIKIIEYKKFAGRRNPSRDMVPVENCKPNNLYYVLFSIENILIGAIGLYLILSNLKKEKVKKE